MSRHRRQQHKRARRGRALQAQLEVLQSIVVARAHRYVAPFGSEQEDERGST